ncbi:MAG: SRPBCC family protein [Xanthomonadales bacterium]|nr:SRPBCC family protein [Xanthomonadales bacterium]
MNQHMQIELLQELVDLHQAKSQFLDESWETVSVDRYLDHQTFEREQQRIFKRVPLIAAHGSELPDPGSFLTRKIGGKPLLLVRGKSGGVSAFLNVCRHRGARLVGEDSGCRHRFSCPYHAWTWDSAGDLVGVPHQQSGFPNLEREQFGLHRVGCSEHAGWIWVALSDTRDPDVAAHLGLIEGEFDGLGADGCEIFDATTRDIHCNWKILVEGGLEAYHFRVAHRKTIAPLFLDNLSSYRCVGRHIRSVLPRSTLGEMAETATESWDIRKHSNVLYSLFPSSQFLVQEDHFVWIQGTPLAPDRTRLRLATMIPTTANLPERQDYWRKHHALTLRTLDEDFSLGESIQQGLSSGANSRLNFGRFEGALARFNQFVDEAIAS